MAAPILPRSFRIPDLVSDCPFSLSYHRQGDIIAEASRKWIEDTCPEFTDKQRAKLHGLKAGELAAYCWPYCDKSRLRIISDFVNLLFHLDDISDDMIKKDTEVLADIILNALWFPESYRPTHAKGKEQPEEEIAAGKLTRSFWSRCIQGGSPGFQARFREHMQGFFEVVHSQARNRANGEIPDIETYLEERRDNGGVKLVFDLIEYALGIDLPDFVVEDPNLKAIHQNANDLILWSNDIFSWNVEQARGDTHNLIFLLMKSHDLDLQGAIDHVGAMCQRTVEDFCAGRRKVPSWGPAIDKDVAGYIRGLEAWMVGSLHWSFLSDRYFGSNGREIKQNRLVSLLPRGRSEGSNAT